MVAALGLPSCDAYVAPTAALGQVSSKGSLEWFLHSLDGVHCRLGADALSMAIAGVRGREQQSKMVAGSDHETYLVSCSNVSRSFTLCRVCMPPAIKPPPYFTRFALSCPLILSRVSLGLSSCPLLASCFSSLQSLRSYVVPCHVMPPKSSLLLDNRSVVSRALMLSLS